MKKMGRKVRDTIVCYFGHYWESELFGMKIHFFDPVREEL